MDEFDIHVGMCKAYAAVVTTSSCPCKTYARRTPLPQNRVVFVPKMIILDDPQEFVLPPIAPDLEGRN